MASPRSDRAPRSGVLPVPPRTRYVIENRVGKLIEIAIASPIYVEDALQWGRDHDAVIDAIRGPYVCVVDLVDATVFPQDVVEAYVAVMKNEPRLLRTGTLLNQSPTFSLQIQRMIQEAQNPNRRTFRAVDPLATWLGEVLDARERSRLAELLGPRRAPSGVAPR